MIPFNVASQETSDRFMQAQSTGLRDALRSLLSIDGVGDVRLILRQKRHGRQARGKVFVVLDSHDVRRDELVVNIICQLEEVDMDLVPRSAVGMIPRDAESLRDAT